MLEVRRRALLEMIQGIVFRQGHSLLGQLSGVNPNLRGAIGAVMTDIVAHIIQSRDLPAVIVTANLLTSQAGRGCQTAMVTGRLIVDAIVLSWTQRLRATQIQTMDV